MSINLNKFSKHSHFERKYVKRTIFLEHSSYKNYWLLKLILADEEIPDPGLYAFIEWATGNSEEKSREAEESPIKAFANTFATVLTAAANTLETAHR